MITRYEQKTLFKRKLREQLTISMSKSELTVTPFDVDVDAHFDAAEGLCLGHGHLHR